MCLGLLPGRERDISLNGKKSKIINLRWHGYTSEMKVLKKREKIS